MKKILFIFILFLSCEVLLSQEQERPNYFPLAIGNKWEYIKFFSSWDDNTNQYVNHRFVMEINRDTIINGKQYYIFEYNIPRENFIIPEYGRSFSTYFFTPVDPVRVDKSGDIYVYDDSTQNEYLYSQFSKSDYYSYKLYGTDDWVRTIPWRGGWWWWYPPANWLMIDIPGLINYGFIFQDGVGMVTTVFGHQDPCFVDNPCPLFWNQEAILVYAIIDGEKVFSIEDSGKYREYIRTNSINSMPTYPQEIKLYQNYPNPFNPETRIDFEIPKTEKV